MRLDELPWKSDGAVRAAMIGPHRIVDWGLISDTGYDIIENWNCPVPTRGRMWSQLDAVTAQCIVYELLKNNQPPEPQAATGSSNPGGNDER